MKKRGKKDLSDLVDVPAGFALARPKRQKLNGFRNWPGGRKKLLLVVAVLTIAASVGAAIWVKSSQKQQGPTGAAANYARELPKLDEAVKSDPKNPDARKKYAVALYATKDLKGAKAQYEEAAKLNDKDATTFNNLGNVYRDLGEFDKAIAAYRRAIELDPKAINPYVNLANVQLYSQNKPDDAIATYRQALESLPNNEQIEILLGIAYEQKGDKESARQVYEAMLDRNPGNTTAKTRLDRLNQEE